MRPVGGWLADRYGARPVTYAMFAMMLVALSVLAVGPRLTGAQLGPWTFFLLIEVIGVGMGIGKASVYKYIPVYYPGDVDAVGGIVGTLGALGGFVMPLAFGYLEQRTQRPESCFVVLALIVAFAFVWLNLVVSAQRRARPASEIAQFA